MRPLFSTTGERCSISDIVEVTGTEATSRAFYFAHSPTDTTLVKDPPPVEPLTAIAQAAISVTRAFTGAPHCYLTPLSVAEVLS
jgi:hypothetical protein